MLCLGTLLGSFPFCLSWVCFLKASIVSSDSSFLFLRRRWCKERGKRSSSFAMLLFLHQSLLSLLLAFSICLIEFSFLFTLLNLAERKISRPVLCKNPRIFGIFFLCLQSKTE